jgi:hypothetical protein
MAEDKESITEFRISLRDLERVASRFYELLEPLKDRIHQSSDLSDIYYTPSNIYTELEAMCIAAAVRPIFLKTILAESIVVLHCSTYVKSFNYVQEEPNIKSIVLSKGYDVGVCTGRSFVKFFCSDLIYADRFFSYRFENRKYWFVCYLSTVDSFELIKDKVVELFGTQRGLQVSAWLEHKFH